MLFFLKNKELLGFTVGLKKACICSAVIFSLILVGSLSSMVFASSENWVEVARFTGSGQLNQSESFSCTHVDWRIRWSFNPSPNVEPNSLLMFHLRVYEVEGELVELFFSPDQTSGTLNYNRTGSFWLYITDISVENYTVIVEQNIDSIPEFPSWIILSMFIVAAFLITIFKTKIKSF